MVTIELSGLQLHGFHGVLERERREGQRFVFDVWAEAPEDAGRADRIQDTVDYRDIAAIVREVSDGRRFDLLEALAAEIAERLLERLPLGRVRVRVRKPDVLLVAPVEYAAVSVERSRS
jgi:dihydroneopterin aldolase